MDDSAPQGIQQGGHELSSESASERWLEEQIRKELRPGRRLSDAKFVEVRSAPGKVVLLFHWRRDRRLYGLPVDLRDTTHEYLYGNPVSSPIRWLEEFPTSLMVHLDTGAVCTFARVARTDFIELDDSRPWLWDARFSLFVIPRHEAGRPSVEVTATVDRPGCDEGVATAVVSGPASAAPELVRLVFSDDAPRSVVLDVARLAVHEAGESGAVRVVTGLSHPDLALLGFTPDGTGSRVVDTAFLEEDREGAAALLRSSSKQSR